MRGRMARVSSPELVEAGLRSRSAGQSGMLFPKTTTEDRVLPVEHPYRNAISNVMWLFSCDRAGQRRRPRRSISDR